MSEEERPNPTEPENGTGEEDVEILEIVGVDDDLPPSGDQDGEEVDIVFDEEVEQEPEAAEPAGLEPAGPVEAANVPEETVPREQLLRLQAEFENLKKRSHREREDFFLHATSSLVSRMLPVVDNFERALEAGSGEDGEQAFRDGVALIYKQLMDELRKEGLKAVESVGQTFDPSVHEAVATDASPDHPSNTVVEELLRGYFFHDRLLRPALVKVNLGGAEVETEVDTADTESET